MAQQVAFFILVLLVLSVDNIFGARFGGSSSLFEDGYEIDRKGNKSPSPFVSLPPPSPQEVGGMVPEGPTPIESPDLPHAPHGHKNHCKGDKHHHRKRSPPSPWAADVYEIDQTVP